MSMPFVVDIPMPVADLPSFIFSPRDIARLRLFCDPHAVSDPIPLRPAMIRKLHLLLLLALVALTLSSRIPLGRAHEHHGEGEEEEEDENDDEDDSSCEANPDVQLVAGYRPGTVTIDGRADDWAGVDGPLLPLLPALDFDEDKAYASGKMTVKAVHDGRNVYFMLQVAGEYAYSLGDDHKCPSVALMFQVGENATYKNMGGCSHMPGSCTDKNCHGHEVDIMHFSVGKAIPGRLYGSNLVDNSKGNGNDSFGHLVDVYAWNPHCRYLDGTGPSDDKSIGKNDWIGAWWHSSLVSHTGLIEEDSPYGKSGEKGTYFFEFSRPLTTMDRFQQDVQFTIGRTSKVAVAFWYPTDGKPWSKSQHFSTSCNWLPLDVAPASELSSVSPVSSRTEPSDAVTSLALLISAVSFCLAIFIGYWASKTKPVPFTPIDSL